jgi:hypothetical protein
LSEASFYSMNDTIEEIRDDWQGIGVCSNPTCDYANGEFCGIDNVCHAYSCEDWYKFGPPDYTGHAQSPGTLTCSSIPVPEEVAGHSAIYGCSAYSNAIDLPIGSSVGLKFTESCVARNANTTFECMQLKSVDDDAGRIENFVIAAEYSFIACDNTTQEPTFMYQVHVGTLEGSVLASLESSYAFNETRVSRTIYSTLSEGSSASTATTSCFWLLIAAATAVLSFRR